MQRNCCNMSRVSKYKLNNNVRGYTLIHLQFPALIKN